MTDIRTNEEAFDEPKSALPTRLQPLSGSALMLGTFALSLATFMNVLDTSIANVSIPAIAGDLGVSSSQGTWVITSFGVANAIAIPLTGFITQRFGAVRVFLVSTLLFMLFSLLCGLASSLDMLILFRVLQGVSAGPMIPLSQTLLLSSYPPKRAGMAMAMWSLATLIAPAMGPLLGGWITDNISWTWIFYINIPIGLLAVVLTWVIYFKRETTTRPVPIDWIGLGLLVVWVGALQIMLDKGQELDWFNSNITTTLAVIAMVGFVLFLIWEIYDEHPVVDLTLFKLPNFTLGTIMLSLAYGMFFGGLVLLPLWLQEFAGYTATYAGSTLAWVGIFAVILSPIVGHYVNSRNARWITTISFLMFALMFWLRSHFIINDSYWGYSLPTVIQGIAMATFFIPLVTITLGGLSPGRIPAAAGLSNFGRIIAGSFGTAIYTTIWTDRATTHHEQLVSQIYVGNPVSSAFIETLQTNGFNHEQALGLINRLINQQAYTIALDEMSQLNVWMYIGLIALVWLTRPAKAIQIEASGAH